jgi:hypothetical protein
MDGVMDGMDGTDDTLFLLLEEFVGSGLVRLLYVAMDLS